MNDLDSAVVPELAAPPLADPILEVGPADVLVALAAFACSLPVLVYALSPAAQFPIFLLLHLAVLVIPASLWTIRARTGGELTLPALLTITTFVSGPIGALGSAVMGVVLWLQAPSPKRLRGWYEHIAGVVARTRLTRIYDELVSGRLPSDPRAEVPCFRPILEGTSLDEQQRMLAVIGRRYSPEFRGALRRALRNRNAFIRAQAAAVAARLNAEEKSRLWSAPQARSAAPAQPRIDDESRALHGTDDAR